MNGTVDEMLMNLVELYKLRAEVEEMKAEAEEMKADLLSELVNKLEEQNKLLREKVARLEAEKEGGEKTE
jgi:predicted Holliday junction resolvase-like endonuclease